MKGFNISIQGFSHIAQNKVCQDSSAYFCDENISIAVVADGHGSEKHFRSDIGSKMAVETTINSIKNFMNDIDLFNKAIIDNSDKILTKIESNILCNWNTIIYNHYKINPITNYENLEFLKDMTIESMYGTTLIAAVMTKYYWFAIQIGDGDCVCVYENGEAKLLIPEDDRLFANFTTSLCDSDAIHNFRHYYNNSILPIALLVSTDGLSSSFFDRNSFLDFNCRIISGMNNYHSNIENLKQHLYKRSKEGSLDDISIAAIYKNDIDFKKLNTSQTA